MNTVGGKPNVQDRKSAIVGITKNWGPEIVDVMRLASRNRIKRHEDQQRVGHKREEYHSVRATMTAKITKRRREGRPNKER